MEPVSDSNVWWRNRIIGPGLKFEDSRCTNHMSHVMDINMREMLPVEG
jgi:hypothetical protein